MKILLSPLAAKTLESILEHVEEKWSRKSRDKAFQKVLDKFKQISDHPHSCPESKIVANTFKCVVSKQTSFIYRTIKNEIEILIFFDNRQNLKKIIEEFKRNKS